MKIIFTVDGKLICFKYKQVGHKRPECPHKDKSVEELQKLFPNTVFCTIALGHTNFPPSEEEVEQPESTGVKSSGSTGVGTSGEDNRANLKPTDLKATTSNNAAAFLQTIQEEHDSEESAASVGNNMGITVHNLMVFQIYINGIEYGVSKEYQICLPY